MRTPRPVWQGAAGAALVCAFLLPALPARGADLVSTFTDGAFPEMAPAPPTGIPTHRVTPRGTRRASRALLPRATRRSREATAPEHARKARLASSGEETRRSG